MNEERVEVTIGLCVKNAEDTISETIRSILYQDYPHMLMELIIVDGNSQDRTLEIIRNELKNSDIKSQILSENKGLGYARELVVKNAGGKYIIWVDSDMILSRDFVKEQVKFMETHPEVGIAKGRYAFIEQKSLVANLENISFLTAFHHKEDVENPFPLGTSGCIYRVEAIRQVGGFDKNISGVGEDMDIEYRIRVMGWKLSLSPAIFYEKRRRTWRSLWNEYFWHGKGAAQLYEKNKRVLLYGQKVFPLTLMINKLIETARAYRMIARKEVLLLPLHYVFKRLAWSIGFIKGRLEGKQFISKNSAYIKGNC